MSLADNSPSSEKIATGKIAAKSGKRMWWFVHHWVGLKLSILMSFILLTGTLAVFSNEIDWLVHKGMRAEVSAQNVEWADIAISVNKAFPEAKIQSIEAPISSYFAARAVVKTENGSKRLVYVHPETSNVQADYGWMTVQRTIRFMHRHLFLPKAWGVPIVSSLSIALLISLVTSLVVYKKWWRGFFKPIRFSKPRLFLGDFHRLIGVWSLWFVTIISITSLWYFIESTGGAAPDQIESAGSSSTKLSHASLVSNLEHALLTATTERPELKIREVLFPEEGSAAFGFRGQEDEILVRDRVNAIWVDAINFQTVLNLHADELSVHARIAEAADPIHFGIWGGGWSRFIWFVFGLALTCLSVSGVTIYGLRISKEVQVREISKSIVTGTHIVGCVSIVIILMAVFLMIKSF